MYFFKQLLLQQSVTISSKGMHTFSTQCDDRKIPFFHAHYHASAN